MNDDATTGEQSPLRLRLEVYLDRQPVSGRLRNEGDAEERFVGWLGFIDALRKLRELQSRGRPGSGQAGPS